MIIIYRIMSNLDIDVLDLFADEGFSLEEAFLTMDQPKEFGYVSNMNCPVPDCNVPGTFSSRAFKIQRQINPDRQDCPYTYTCNC